MTSRASQGAILVAASGDPLSKAVQAAILVAVTPQPDTSPSLANQAALLLAVRIQGRRLVVTTD